MPHRHENTSLASAPKARSVHTKQLALRVPAHIDHQLGALAQRENNSISAVVRRLLTAALAREGVALP